MFRTDIQDLIRLVALNAPSMLPLAVGLVVWISSPSLANTGAKGQGGSAGVAVNENDHGRETNFKVVSCAPDEALTEKFRRTTSEAFQNSLHQPLETPEARRFTWAGADAAYSISIGNYKTLWLFGDTFLREGGRGEEGGRVGGQGGRGVGGVGTNSKSSLQMINNSIAVQQIDVGETVALDQKPLKFFWRQPMSGNHSFFEDANANRLKHWLWPLDGFYRNGKLYEFVNEIRKSQDATPAFGFDTSNQLLLEINNIEKPADKWKMKFSAIDAPNMQIGSAVVADEFYAYVFCSYYPARLGMNKHPQIVIRLPLDKLDNYDISELIKSAEVWSRNEQHENNNKGHWIKSSMAQPEILMQDGAPEFSVTRVRGFEGYFAVYFPSGFGTKIMLRHALRPEGPWSEPQCIYECPVDVERFFVYSAKSHPELCTKDGELCITYCENIKSSDSTSLEPEKFYFPHAIKMQLKRVTLRSELVR